ncbi:MAG: GDSL-type esterase/lipase family protein [Thermoguttaceae bacterium]|jgi:lysophospholipase L1-like esterase|nr:GDSL-type esterase/lipase family protein [Thermoguttaceae bacterium]
MKALFSRWLVTATVLLAVAPVPAAAPAKAKTPPAATIGSRPQHAMIPAGGSIELALSLADAEGRPLAGQLTARVDVAAGVPAPTASSTIVLDAAGNGRYRFQAAADAEPGIHTIELRHEATNTLQTLYVDVLDVAAYEEFETAAAGLRFPALPAHLLFIGDSLTDQRRGQNYVDKVAFWLWKRFGDQATARNAGVGGDYILRVWDRLNRQPGSYRPEMYDDLYRPMPSHVFFFLGHNDSKLKSTTDYEEAVVPPAQFEEKYRLAIRKVQTDTQQKARVVVLSATSSVYEITQSTAEKRRAAGRAHNLFGKPEALEQFNAIARRVAGECGAEWLDVYEPTRGHPDKPSLFTPDGVHVSNLGNRLLALEILRYLAEAM